MWSCRNVRISIFPFLAGWLCRGRYRRWPVDLGPPLAVAPVVAAIDEYADQSFKGTGQIVDLQEHTVLRRLVLASIFTLGLKMEWCAPNVTHLMAPLPLGKVTR